MIINRIYSPAGDGFGHTEFLAMDHDKALQKYYLARMIDNVLSGSSDTVWTEP